MHELIFAVQWKWTVKDKKHQKSSLYELYMKPLKPCIIVLCEEQTKMFGLKLFPSCIMISHEMCKNQPELLTLKQKHFQIDNNDF